MQLLREDYLEHRTLYEAVQSIITDRARQHPVRILDLGCGDSDYIALVLYANKMFADHAASQGRLPGA